MFEDTLSRTPFTTRTSWSLVNLWLSCGSADVGGPRWFLR